MTSLLQAGLLEDAAQRAGWNFKARLAGHGDRTRLLRMMILTMAPLLTSEEPPVRLEAEDQIVNFDRHLTPSLSALRKSIARRLLPVAPGPFALQRIDPARVRLG